MVDIRDPKFWDEADLDRELRRVFDVCHTCRMCFSYCPSFPALFDAVDRHEEKGEGEVDALTAEEIAPVVDLCWQCKLCYVKCPYTPPHKFMVDFPRLLQRAKLVKVRREGVPFRERILGDPDRLGRMSVGLASGMTNWANTRPLIRRALEKLLGIHRQRVLPSFARKPFRKWFRGRRRTLEPRVALFATCSVEYNEPQVGVAAVQVLEHNGVGVELPDVVCCGLPALDGGDLETATRKIERNVRALLPLVQQGRPVVVLGPSCGLMMKSEWPQIVPTDECRTVSAAVMDVGEYLGKLRAEGKLDLTFSVSQGKLAYHVPCHLRAQNIGQPFRALLESVPDTKVEPIEQCSAFDGTWGMKTEYYETSRKCAGKLCKAIGRAGADRVISDCTLAGLNVVEELGIKPAHPIEALRDAYGLQGDRRRPSG
ncbi:MAG TPA: heterodisulfide reductase-related iron-sulfur binding cluster [Thermoanaerobaculia bacterium]|nr:heterodisulfide reductase-related iron-sulfur binding cluster [Thermoanaerobaculia bacterium]